MFRKIVAFIICSVAILLPYKLRIIFVEGLGWVTQFLYLSYVTVLKFIIDELAKNKLENKTNG